MKVWFRKINIFLIVAAVLAVGLFLINWIWFFGIAPLVTNPKLPSQYRDIGSMDNIDELLWLERVFFGVIFKKTTSDRLVKTDKVFSDDLVYVYDQDPKYSVEKNRPVKYADFSRMKFFGQTVYVVTERVINRDGSASFLHFGYSPDDMDVDEFEKIIVKQVTAKNTYFVPVAKVSRCDNYVFAKLICETLNKDDLLDDINVWVQTGIVPERMEMKLLIPYLAAW